MRLFTIFFLCLSNAFLLHGQELISEHIMTVDSSFEYNADYRVATLDWIAGSWEGIGLGGEVEEIWTAPKNGQMLCLFRYDNGGEMIFSEHCTMMDTPDGVKFRVRHFNGDFTAWEDKEKFIEFPLIATEGQTAYFDGCTFIREGAILKIYVFIEHEGVGQEELFEYRLK